jgi:uncharacterized protein
MPVRSLNSSVFKWPDAAQVDRAVRSWAASESRRHLGVVKLGYFGSYATGKWGVGSDLDLVAIVDRSDEPFMRRALRWELHELPVPAELIVYTVSEWDSLIREGGRFARTMESDTVWVYEAAADPKS